MTETTIYLKSVKRDLGSGMKHCLEMRDSNGNSGVNELETVVPSESLIKWVLDDNSGIKNLKRIWAKGVKAKGKGFKYEPKKKLFKQEFNVEVVEAHEEILETYNILYKADDGTKVPIDPYIRIKPSSSP